MAPNTAISRRSVEDILVVDVNQSHDADSCCIIDEFEMAWLTGRPDIPPFLDRHPCRPRSLLVELVAIDLENRLKRCEAARVEDYLPQFAEIVHDPDAMLDLVSVEYRFRKRNEPGLDVDEYRHRFPAYDDRLSDPATQARLFSMSRLPAADIRELKLGADIGGVTLVRVIAEGGMGRVYEGLQHSPSRAVAVKVMKPGFISQHLLRRFGYEAELLGRLRHPGIAQIFSAGTHESEDKTVPYFVMEYVNNPRTIVKYADDMKLSSSNRMQLFREVCNAVAHGHQRGVIHRDLKPGNILVDSSGHPKVIDFGIARATDAELALTTMQTDAGQLLGTFQYMSPEQFDADPDDLDVRSDVYSLGMVLYELLAGRPPYDVSSRAVYEVARIVREDEPEPLSNLNRSLGRDVCRIVGRCLQKDRERRYSSAAELSADIGRCLAGEPIEAWSPGLLEGIVRLARRHRIAAAATAGVLVATAVASFVTSYFAYEALRQRRNAIEQRDLATYNQYVADMHLALQDWKGGQLDRMDTLLAAHLPDSSQPDQRGWEWHYLQGLANDAAVTTIIPASGPAEWTAWSPDGSMLAVGAAHVEIWKPGNAAPLRTLERQPSRRSSHLKWSGPLAWSPDGTRLAIGSGGTVGIWDPLTATLIFCLSAQEHPISQLCWSPDGKQLATGDDLGAIRLWEASAGAKPVVRRGSVSCVRSLAWSPDGRWMAVGDNHRGMLDVWDVVAQELVHSQQAHDHFIRGLAWSPDCSRLATGSNDQHVRVWNTHDWTIALDLADHLGCVSALAWSPDGRWLATGSSDCIVRIWDAATGSCRNALRGHRGEVLDVSWEPNGERIAAAGAPGTVKVWKAFATQDARVAAVRAPAAWRRDGRSIVAGSAEQGLSKIWDISHWSVQKDLRTSTHGYFRSFDWSPTGLEVAACDFSGQIVVWDVSSGQEIWKVEGAAKGLPLETTELRSIAWSPDGTQVATGAWDKAVHIREANTGRLLRSLPGFGERVGSVVWSPDGMRLAAKDCGDKIMIWNAQSWQVELTMRCHDEPAFAADGSRSLAWSPAGERLAAGTSEGELILWNAQTGQRLSTFGGHTGGIRAVAWSPDGRRLASGGEDRMLRIYDATTGKELLTLECEKTWIHTVAWSPDGSRLIAGNREIRLWDAPGMR